MRQRSGCPFVPVARNLLDNFAIHGIRASEWKNRIWNAEYCEGASRLCTFVPRTGAKFVGMDIL